MSQTTQPIAEDEEDWFNKDENDFVVEIPSNAAAGTAIAEKEVDDCQGASVREMLDNLKFTADDVDGNYIDSLKRSDPAGLKHSSRKVEPGKYVQTIPFTKLTNVLDNETVSMFADLYVQKEEFLATLTKRTYGEELMLVLMRIMIKLGSMPLYETATVQFNDTLVRFCDALLGVLSEKDQKHRELLEELKTFPTEEHPTKKISIYPTVKELRADAGPSLDLKRNIVHGKYESVEHYLDVHLNLLKEDFLIPLRSGLEKYRASVAKHSREWTFVGENIRVHYPVKLLLPSTINRRTVKEQLIVVDLDPANRGYSNESARYRRLSLPNSKRLLNGSMVLFSSGPQMDDLVVAVISCRDPNQLLDGYINVELIRLDKDGESNDDTGMNIFNRPLLMIESEIFFEPYHQTFNALVRLREENFPLKSYIVDVSQPVQRLPRYFTEGKGHLFVNAGIEFDLKLPESWPKESLKASIGLNESQFEAYRMALTNRFTLIQGPPGTGKTFIGLKIVETLLANTSEQILIICLTNHALDQFLCGVTRFTESIVRMGGQSKHPLLDAYNVKQLHEDEQIDRRLRICYYNAKQQYLKLVEQFDELQEQQREGFDGLSKPMRQCMDKLLDASRRLNELSQLGTLKLIQHFRVVAMTTTFAARNRTLLELLRTPIVVIEEAAEVLEAHIVSSLTQHTEQLILIGDHKQLRPTTSTYVLSRRYKMDLSLFERMINNRFSAATMTVQHRMRPEIANLLRPTIYLVLEDRESVQALPGIVGMKKSLFFLRHTFPEGAEPTASKSSKDGQDEHGAGDEKSKRNVFESKFLLALCEYLLAQGPYTAQDIVILTAYNGQMLQLVSEKKNRAALQGVRIAVIDNYQGEESRIILLSLVRSGNLTTNGDGNTIGFLSHENRICVALSRAREGLYIVGNMGLLARCSKTWHGVERRLDSQEAIGDSLPLQCTQHGQVVEVKTPEDFEQFTFDGKTCICGILQR
ncbi:AGAP006235-PA-like protein [Anopheles sinensis]|uniref:AAA domain-containing protein n=1 Tax=Anopheles sinensis TaxID=74873 RepID=A0A084VDN6_ANOSI|nr:AGAP006235-PA-like protein [Anopheles sinensis]